MVEGLAEGWRNLFQVGLPSADLLMGGAVGQALRLFVTRLQDKAGAAVRVPRRKIGVLAQMVKARGN